MAGFVTAEPCLEEQKGRPGFAEVRMQQQKLKRPLAEQLKVDLTLFVVLLLSTTELANCLPE